MLWSEKRNDYIGSNVLGCILCGLANGCKLGSYEYFGPIPRDGFGLHVISVGLHIGFNVMGGSSVSR